MIGHYRAKFKNLYRANKVLCLAILASVIVLFFLGQLTSNEQVSFIGLAESKQLKVSYDQPVQVKKIMIIPGQQVKKGDLLVEVQQPELEVKINTLNNEISSLINEFKLSKEIATQKKFIESDFAKYSDDPQILLISSKNKQLEYLYNQKRKQKYYADFNGFVDAVFFKAGEIVSSFTPIVQINSISPDYAKIYLLEGSHNQLSLDEEVTISSLVSNYKVRAQVVNLGKSMVQLPTRLQIAPQIIQWGREARIKLPENNKFLVGEKIHVTNSSKGFLVKKAKAEIVSEPYINASVVNDKNGAEILADITGRYQLKNIDKGLNFKIIDSTSNKQAFPKLSKQLESSVYKSLRAKSASYKMKFLKDFQVISFTLSDSSLYLGLKSKSIESKLIILKADNFKENITKELDLSIWKEIELPVNHNLELANIAIKNSKLVFTANSGRSEQKQMTYAFELDISNDKLKLINSWNDRVIQSLKYDSQAKTMNLVLSSKSGGGNNEIIVIR